MDISVIIVSYNECEFLKRAVMSCLNQNFSGKMEIIIGDDGSSDNSIEIINELESEYHGIIKHFVMDRTGSGFITSIRVSDVIKKGLAISKGKYISILSADDVFCSDYKFENAYKFLETNTMYSGVFSDYIISWTSNNNEYVCPVFPAARKILMARNFLHISAFVFRRYVYTNNFLTDRFCDDIGMIYSIYLAGKVKHISGATFNYIKRGESIMNTLDNIEKDIMEILLLQDFLNKGKYVFSCLALYSNPLKRLYNRRNELFDAKYRKYIKCSSERKNDLLCDLRDYDNSKLKKKVITKSIIFISGFSNLFFRTLSRILMVFFRRGKCK